MKALIIYNCETTDLEKWFHPLNHQKIEFDICHANGDWEDAIDRISPDIIIFRPNGSIISFKRHIEEIIEKVNKCFSGLIYPSKQGLLIYENKPLLSFLLKQKNVPHPFTHYFNSYESAKDFTNNCNLPIVVKSNSGAAGSGVHFLKTREHVHKFLHKVFIGSGFPKRIGPNMQQGDKLRRLLNKLIHPSDLLSDLKGYKRSWENPQKGEIIFQEFIPHTYEWRAVRIGDSFFAHKKIAEKGKASGTKLKDYDNPPLKVFDFVYEVSEKLKIESAAFDLFETDNGDFLVNEIQVYFGQSDPYQMLVDGKPARYIRKNNSWHSEFGDFTSNKCYDLRVKHIKNLLEHTPSQNS